MCALPGRRYPSRLRSADNPGSLADRRPAGARGNTTLNELQLLAREHCGGQSAVVSRDQRSRGMIVRCADREGAGKSRASHAMLSVCLAAVNLGNLSASTLDAATCVGAYVPLAHRDEPDARPGSQPSSIAARPLRRVDRLGRASADVPGPSASRCARCWSRRAARAPLISDPESPASVTLIVIVLQTKPRTAATLWADRRRSPRGRLAVPRTRTSISIADMHRPASAAP